MLDGVVCLAVADNDGFTCFEVLGFDVMMDHKGHPYLIEVGCV